MSHSLFHIEDDAARDTHDVVIHAIAADVEGRVNRLSFFVVVVEAHVAGDPRCRGGKVDLGKCQSSTDQVGHIRSDFRIVVVKRATDEQFTVAIGVRISGTGDRLSQFMVRMWNPDSGTHHSAGCSVVELDRGRGSGSAVENPDTASVPRHAIGVSK